MYVLTGGYVLLAVIAIPNALSTTDALYGAIRTASFILFLFLADQFLRSNYKENLPHLIKAISVFICIGIIGGFYSQLTVTLKNDTFDPYWYTSLFANKNLFSSILFMSLPFSLYAFFHQEKIWKQIAFFNLVSSLYFMIILTGRSVWLAVLSFSVGLLAYYLLTKKTNSLHMQAFKQIKEYYPALIVFVLLTSAMLAMQPKQLTSLLTEKTTHIVSESRQNVKIESYYNPTKHEPGSVESRLLLWKKTLAMIQEHPYIGVGMDNWRLNYGKYGLHDMDFSTRQGEKHFQRVHNDWLSVAAETGLASLLIFLGWFVFIFIKGIQLLQSDAQQKHKDLTALLLLMLIGYMIISFFDFPKERIEHNLFLMLAFAIIISMPTSNKQKQIQLNLLGWHKLLIGAATLLIFVTAINRLKGDAHTYSLFYDKQFDNHRNVITHGNNAENFVYTTDPVSTSIAFYKGLAYSALQQPDSALICYKQAEQLTPYHLHTINNIATCYATAGNFEEAIIYYKKALVIANDFEDAQINLAAIYFNKKEYKTGYPYIRDCNPNSAHKNYRLTLNAYESVMK